QAATLSFRALRQPARWPKPALAVLSVPLGTWAAWSICTAAPATPAPGARSSATSRMGQRKASVACFRAKRGVKACPTTSSKSPTTWQTGLIGETPKLLDLQDVRDLKMNVDFRRVYATVLEKWLGLPAKPAPWEGTSSRGRCFAADCLKILNS